MPFFLNIATSPSRNRLCRSLIRLLLVSTVYIRSSKQREFFAVFVPKSPVILGPHGAGGVAVPRCPFWVANPTATPMIRTPKTIPKRPKRVRTNCFFMCLLVNASVRCVGQNNASSCCCEILLSCTLSSNDERNSRRHCCRLRFQEQISRGD